jgi:uncharacterized protein
MAQEESDTQMVVNNFLKKLDDHDAGGMGELFADDIDWYVPGNTSLPWVGSRSHRADVVNYFRTMWPYFEESKSIVTPGSTVVSGNEVVLFASFQHTVGSNGRSYTTPVALHLTITGSKIVRLHLYEDTWIVSRAFFD